MSFNSYFMKRQSLFKLIAVFSVAVVTLSACGKKGESSDVVLQKFQTAVSQITSATSDLSISVKGKDDKETVDFGVKATLKMDQTEKESIKTDVMVDVKGSMLSEGKSLTGALTAGVRILGNDFYAKLDKLETSDESVNSIKPFIQPYVGKWLHVASDFIPENIRKISAPKDETALKQEAEMKKLFAESKMITVVKEFGTEKINGEKTYHYGVRFNEEGVRDYFKKVAALNNPQITEAEMQVVEKDLNDAIKALTSISSAEVWIGASDYLPYKGVMVLSGDSFKQEGQTLPVDLKVEVTYEGSDFNKSLNLTAPEGAEEFNPLSLLTGAAGVPTTATMPVPGTDTPELQVEGEATTPDTTK